MTGLSMGALWLGLWALAPDVALPQYPGAQTVAVGNDLKMDGLSHRLAYFLTDDGLDSVARFFVEKWAVEGLPTTVTGDGRDSCAVAAFWTREAMQSTVVLVKHRGRTLGFVVLKDLRRSAEDRRGREVAPGEGVLYADGAAQTAPGTLAMIVHRPMAEVRRNVETRMRAEHFGAVSSSAVAPSSWSLVHERQGDRRWTFLTALDPETTAVVETR